MWYIFYNVYFARETIGGKIVFLYKKYRIFVILDCANWCEHISFCISLSTDIILLIIIYILAMSF